MFRNLSKPQLTKIKQQIVSAFVRSILVYSYIFQGLSSEKNRLYLFQGISSVPNVHLWSV